MEPKPLAYDTETTGLNRWKGARMFSFSTCAWDGKSKALRETKSAGSVNPRPIIRPASPYEIELERIWAKRNEDLPKIMHNARFDIGMTQDKLARTLDEMRGHEIHETMALSHLVQNDHHGHRLEDLGWELFGFSKELDKAVKPYKSSERGMLACPVWLWDKYSCADAERTMLCFRGLSKKVRELGLWHIYEMERALVWTTLSIEERGVQLYPKRCQKMIDEFEEKTEQALSEYQSIADTNNAMTDAELRRFLYKKLGLPILKYTSKDHRPSVDKNTLADLQLKAGHPVFDAITRYKSYRRGVTLLRGYLEAVDTDGIIHPNIHPYRAATGRGSVTRPNLLNVETSTALRNKYPVPARKAFGPKPGHVNYHLDYKGIQMLLLIHESQDPEFLKIVHAGGDTHEEGAKELYGDRFTKVNRRRSPKKWKALRDAAKNGDFCLGFGGGPEALSHCLGLSLPDTVPGYNRWKKRFKELAVFSRQKTLEVRRNGYVKTFTGRILHVPRAKPYAGTVYTIQGDEAEILKPSQIRVEEYLRESTGNECGINLPVYDELIIEVPRKRMREFENELLPNVKKLMTGFPEISLPLTIETEISTHDWNNTKPLRTPGRRQVC